MTQQQLFGQFTEDELATLKQATEILNRLFQGHKPKQTRGWRVRQSTRDFMEDVQRFYGKEWVYRYDEEFIKIQARHQVTELSNWLKMYEKGGFIDVVRVQNTNRNIVKFRFV
jgi:GH25 family lysozyme M1 (1,4-beta-N-acetylmuramidase)